MDQIAWNFAKKFTGVKNLPIFRPIPATIPLPSNDSL